MRQPTGAESHQTEEKYWDPCNSIMLPFKKHHEQNVPRTKQYMRDVDYNSCQLFYPKRIADLRLPGGEPAGPFRENVSIVVQKWF